MKITNTHLTEVATQRGRYRTVTGTGRKKETVFCIISKSAKRGMLSQNQRELGNREQGGRAQEKR